MTVRSISLDELAAQSHAPVIVVATTLDASLLACGGTLAALASGSGLRVLELEREASDICRRHSLPGAMWRSVDRRLDALGASEADLLRARSTLGNGRRVSRALADEIAALAGQLDARAVLMPCSLGHDGVGQRARALVRRLLSARPGLRVWWYDGRTDGSSRVPGGALADASTRTALRTFDASEWRALRRAALPRLGRRGANRDLQRSGPDRFRLAVFG